MAYFFTGDMIYDKMSFLKNEKKRVFIFFSSLLFNLVLLVLLWYIVCIKTNLYNRVLSNLGLSTYSVVDSRHRIEFRCIEGWKNTLEKININADAVFYGNSITFESNFQNDFPQLKLCNLGCNRDNLDDLIHRSFLIKSVHPSKIFVLGGINGFVSLSLNEFKKKYELLIDTIKSQNPHAKLYLQSILPVNANMGIGVRYLGLQDKIKDANTIIQEISLNKNCVYVDLYSVYQVDDSLPERYTRDGLHLYPEAYSIWSRLISSYLYD